VTARVRSGWIVSPGYDLRWFLGSALIPFGFWALAAATDTVGGVPTAIVCFLGFQLLFNMPHNLQTWVMSYLDVGQRARYRTELIRGALVVVAVVGGAALISPRGLYFWVSNVVVYWGYYHLVRQHWGFNRLYAARGPREAPQDLEIDQATIWVLTLAPLMYRWAFGEMTIHVGDLSVALPHPPTPAWVGHMAWMLAVAFGASWVWRQHQRVAEGRFNEGSFLLMTAVGVSYWLAVAVCSDLVIAIAMITAWHNIQYLGLTWFHHGNRARRLRQEAPERAPRLAGWAADGKIGLMVVLCAAYGIVVFAPFALLPALMGLPPTEAPPQAEVVLTSVVALHYYVDSLLWRVGSNAELRRDLAL
jgi:hypothetical protein